MVLSAGGPLWSSGATANPARLPPNITRGSHSARPEQRGGRETWLTGGDHFQWGVAGGGEPPDAPRYQRQPSDGVKEITTPCKAIGVVARHPRLEWHLPGGCLSREMAGGSDLVGRAVYRAASRAAGVYSPEDVRSVAI